MKKTKKKKFLWAAAAALALSIAGGATIAQASDDVFRFEFNIRPYIGTTTTGFRYRQTNSSSNPWKVGVFTSAEGNGSYYNFHLQHRSGAPASIGATAYTGPDYPYLYRPAYASASHSDVQLAGQNAVSSTSYIYITGGWDEETW